MFHWILATWELEGVDTFARGNLVKLGSAALEEILCRVGPTGAVADLVPHALDAWSIEFPALDVLPRFEGEPARLRICIATEDIVGPVRNGGIGTTYSALAELLAGLGHDVVILYLKGYDVENGTIEQWIDFYAAKSVRFVPVPNYAAIDRFQTGADRWLHAPYNMLKYLIDHPMDVVHVSEWRGSGYLSLLAKRQRLAFQDTLFIVKTSSPWIWNRLYGSQPLDRVDDLAKVHAERRSVEFADMVIGGSLHLLRWMASQGYRIPRDRTFVQPNVATFDHLAELMTRDWERGKRYPIDELVFFGRLEARKGLFIFIQAIKRLLRQGQGLPERITFMGKPGARLMARLDQDIIDYIRAETSDWPTRIEVLSEYQQYEALQYLLSGNRLAIMPSMIENSSLAVHEAAICGIPFIASRSGGTPELIAESDRDEVLCDAHPIPFAAKIAEALDRGGYVARPSFDNHANLETWRRFHLDLGRGLREKLLPQENAIPVGRDSASICIYHPDTEDKLRATLASIKEQDHLPEQVLIAVDADDLAAVERAHAVVDEIGLPASVLPAFDLDAGQSFNMMAEQTGSEFVLFLWSGSTIRPMALRALTKVAISSNSALVNYFFRVTHGGDAAKDYLSAIVFGNVAQSFFRTDFTSLPLLVRRRTFAELNGFSTDYRVLAHDHELVAKAQLGGIHCETALLELGTVPAWDEQWLRVRGYDQVVAQFRAIRPELAATPLALRELLLMAKGLQKGAIRRRRPAAKARASNVEVTRDPGLGWLLGGLAKGVLGKQKRKATKPGPAPAQSPPQDAERSGRHRVGVAEAPVQFSALEESDSPAPLESREVARAARRDRVAAREAAVRGAGLVQLIDDLSADGAAQNAAPANDKPARGARISDARSPVTEPVIQPPAASHWLSAIASNRYSARLLGVHRGIVYGWARSEDRPNKAVEIEILNQRGGSQFVQAGIELPSVLPVPSDLMSHGFAVPLWMGWPGLHRYRQGKHLVLRIKDTGIVLGELSVRADPEHLEKAGFDGHCDIVDSMVRGWVWQPSNPDAVVDVCVFVDDRFLARASASDVRDDLRAANIGNGAYGFTVPLPPQLRDGTRRRVDVVVADAGVFLKQGRLQLVGNSLAPIKKGRRRSAAS